MLKGEVTGPGLCSKLKSGLEHTQDRIAEQPQHHIQVYLKEQLCREAKYKRENKNARVQNERKKETGKI